MAQLIKVPPLEGERARIVLPIHEVDMVRIIDLLLVVLLNDRSESQLLVQSVLVLDRLIVESLHIGFFTEALFFLSLQTFLLRVNLAACMHHRQVVLDSSLQSLHYVLWLQVLGKNSIESDQLSPTHVFL